MAKAEQFYERKNYAVFKGKKIGRFIADLISVRDETLTVAIEAKPNDPSEIRKGIGQASSYLDWVHRVYLIVPPESIELCRELLRHSPIGILTVIRRKVSVVKDSGRNQPDLLKLTRLLNSTVGFCWVCGRTFNVVRPSRDDKEEEPATVYVAHKDFEPGLFRALERLKGGRIQTKGSWVSICTVCSRIIGAAIHEYLMRALKQDSFEEEYSRFDFEDSELEEIGELMQKR